MEPVPRKCFPMYYRVIKHPTNMRLIKTHIEKKSNYSLEKLEEEVMRLWSNCIEFN